MEENIERCEGTSRKMIALQRVDSLAVRIRRGCLPNPSRNGQWRTGQRPLLSGHASWMMETSSMKVVPRKFQTFVLYWTGVFSILTEKFQDDKQH